MVALVRNRRIETRSCTADGLCSLVQNIAPGGRSTHEPRSTDSATGCKIPAQTGAHDEAHSICGTGASR